MTRPAIFHWQVFFMLPIALLKTYTCKSKPMKPEELILLQIKGNQWVNLLSPRQQNGFQFSATTKALIRRIISKQLSFQEEQKLLQHTTRTTLSALYRINQYYHFDKQAESTLLSVYQQLMKVIKCSNKDFPDFDALAEGHYLRLQKWFVQNQPQALLHYSPSIPVIKEPVTCSEYSVVIQFKVLGIDCCDLKEPILDVGCGREHHLVNYLQQKGLDVYGIDREAMSVKRVSRTSWLDYDFKPGYWGTIISHLGFTNHFHHHHLKAGSGHFLYAKKYWEILQSLEVNGKFYYTPGLPFIETFLDPSHYFIQENGFSKLIFMRRPLSGCRKRRRDAAEEELNKSLPPNCNTSPSLSW
jgi:hypothetical protein